MAFVGGVAIRGLRKGAVPNGSQKFRTGFIRYTQNARGRFNALSAHAARAAQAFFPIAAGFACL